MHIVVTRVTPPGLFNGVVGIFTSYEALTEGIKAYEAKQKEEDPQFKLTALIDLHDPWPVKLHPTITHRDGEHYITGGLDSYHLSMVSVIDNPVGVPLPDPNTPGYTMKE